MHVQQLVPIFKRHLAVEIVCSPRHAFVRHDASFGHKFDDGVEALHVVVGSHHPETVPDEVVQLRWRGYSRQRRQHREVNLGFVCRGGDLVRTTKNEQSVVHQQKE